MYRNIHIQKVDQYNYINYNIYKKLIVKILKIQHKAANSKILSALFFSIDNSDDIYMCVLYLCFSVIERQVWPST